MEYSLLECPEANQEHQESKRQYAHTFHIPDTICVARAFWKLPARYRDAILLHEIGHLLAGPSGSEQDANRAVEAMFGVVIEYVDCPHGKRLESL